jgi:hypothetical protein
LQLRIFTPFYVYFQNPKFTATATFQAKLTAPDCSPTFAPPFQIPAKAADIRFLYLSRPNRAHTGSVEMLCIKVRHFPQAFLIPYKPCFNPDNRFPLFNFLSTAKSLPISA